MTKGIEVHTPQDAPEITRKLGSELQALFEGETFARLVRQAVEEMILEGKLAYDMENDTFDVPEDIVKEWARKMEDRGWPDRAEKR
ncbi:MAG: hypothetical protein QCI82_02315 [Candidatus Thermoplasmatota archaeon]|nr:hypothetical protein [Candidatus Thermoplasmatota archaeon]